MRIFVPAILTASVLGAHALLAETHVDWSGISADVVILGEIHDNPVHHDTQAEAVATLDPAAVVYEMLTADEAARLADVERTPEAMQRASAGFHWGNISDYSGVLAASSVIVGAALPREDARAAFTDGAAAIFGPDAQSYGLRAALPEGQLQARQEMQFAAHCEAMPMEMMGGMVEAQRLRDAAFARAVLDALDTYGSPVVLITGNGHARTDWGVPSYIVRVRPDVTVFSLGQGEGGAVPDGGFTQTLADAPPAERGDPCKAFQ